jgi:hypothetical protein
MDSLSGQPQEENVGQGENQQQAAETLGIADEDVAEFIASVGFIAVPLRVRV